MIQHTGSIPAGLSSIDVHEKLVSRAKLLAAIRRYFLEQGVLEVETPLLGNFAVSDPQLENIRVEKPFAQGEWLYLQTSPEYSLKHLLALGSGSIYQLGKAFRHDPVGRLHHHEFTLLEWYRLGFSLHALIDDVVDLVGAAGISRPKRVLSYRQAFIDYVDIDPFQITDGELTRVAKALVDIDASKEPRDFWLDLLLTHCIEPHLGRDELTFLTGYPASQAALAKVMLDENGLGLASRFELYIDGVEIANGYDELTDSEVYRQRFEADNAKRLQLGMPQVAIDEDFLAAINGGIPACSGVALGVDRLLLMLN